MPVSSALGKVGLVAGPTVRAMVVVSMVASLPEAPMTYSSSPLPCGFSEYPMPKLTSKPCWPGTNPVTWQAAVAVLTRKSSPSS